MNKIIVQVGLINFIAKRIKNQYYLMRLKD